MYNHIFDTHAHYDDLKFDEDRDELLLKLGADPFLTSNKLKALLK